MRFRALFAITILTSLLATPANAAEVTEKITFNKKVVATFTIVDSVTLDPNGCKDLYIKYTIDRSYYFPNSYLMFGLYAKDKNEAQSVYVQPGNGKGTQGKDAWVGEKEMIFCGKAKSFVNEYGDKVVAPAFTKGNYTFLARFVVIKPKMVTTTSREITFKVK